MTRAHITSQATWRFNCLRSGVWKDSVRLTYDGSVWLPALKRLNTRSAHLLPPALWILQTHDAQAMGLDEPRWAGISCVVMTNLRDRKSGVGKTLRASARFEGILALAEVHRSVTGSQLFVKPASTSRTVERSGKLKRAQRGDDRGELPKSGQATGGPGI